MNLRTITTAFSSWMSAVAALLVAMVGRMRSPRRVRLVEEDDEVFKLETGRVRGVSAGRPTDRLRIANGRIEGVLPAALATELRGSCIELVLRSDRFLSRALELPKRATEFLAGIVRAQIDRLTPWSADDAVFGWAAPRELANDRVQLTVVATARALLAPYLRALNELGAGSIVVSTVLPGENAAVPVRVLEHDARGELGIERARRLLTAVFLGMGLAAGIALGAGQLVGDALDARQQDLQRQIAERRAAMRRIDVTGAPPAQRMLERRKHETPSSVMVLEALSQILPDHTYVTELRIESDKLQVIGVTQDAPSLIRLIEQSPHFTRATFFAPTTRSSTDPGERFHIEARIKPVFGAPT
jgi:general secretion pathway protein L